MDTNTNRVAKIYFSCILPKRPVLKKEKKEELAIAILQVVEDEAEESLGELDELISFGRYGLPGGGVVEMTVIRAIGEKHGKSAENIKKMERKIEKAWELTRKRNNEVYAQNNPVPDDLYDRIMATECYNRLRVVEGLKQQIQASPDLDWEKIEGLAYTLIDRGHVFDGIRVLQGMSSHIQNSSVKTLISF